ncbi:jacalin-like lectin domain-containing protein [Artemisia annua]|uniref:Jacalin-like lectin domain-containing protein n=1 Tax=Artemisia annua TaxID=35608 RepID=A0A2U1LXR6_ARTAN|nr:jacalin-like lectin domain-containing protein [Artemisia annua]
MMLGPQHRVLHRDIKSSNILLDENWEAKISDFGLSKIGPANVDYTFLVSSPCGTMGYVDPQYVKTGVLTKESDVYSFGVVLFEILCGRPTIVNRYEDERRSLASLAQQYFEQNRLHDIIHPNLKNEMKQDSLYIFSMLAYECLKDKRSERPTMASIVRQLEKALKVQVSSKFGVKASGEIISEVSLDSDEEIVGINGTIGTQEGYLSISSLSFETTKRTHGPYGQVKGTVFSLPWKDGSLAGFYGLATDHFESIGIYARASKEIIKNIEGCYTLQNWLVVGME